MQQRRARRVARQRIHRRVTSLAVKHESILQNALATCPALDRHAVTCHVPHDNNDLEADKVRIPKCPVSNRANSAGGHAAPGGESSNPVAKISPVVHLIDLVEATSAQGIGHRLTRSQIRTPCIARTPLLVSQSMGEPLRWNTLDDTNSSRARAQAVIQQRLPHSADASSRRYGRMHTSLERLKIGFGVWSFWGRHNRRSSSSVGPI